MMFGYVVRVTVRALMPESLLRAELPWLGIDDSNARDFRLFCIVLLLFCFVLGAHLFVHLRQGFLVYR